MSIPRRLPDTPQSVIGRVAVILEAFRNCRAALSLSEISRRAGLPVSTTHRLVSELSQWGALDRDEKHRYRIGNRLRELTAQAPLPQ